LNVVWRALVILFAGIALGWWLGSSSAETWLVSVALVIMVCGLSLVFIRQKRTLNTLGKLNVRLNQQINTQNILQSKLKLYASVFTNSREGMLITDCQGRILAINP